MGDLQEPLSAMTEEAEVVEGERKRFESLRPWRPDLYLNTHDYITFFEATQNVLPQLRRLMNTPHCIRHNILCRVGVELRPDHLIPCAKLVICRQQDMREPHRLLQWCDVQLSSVEEVEARLLPSQTSSMLCFS